MKYFRIIFIVLFFGLFGCIEKEELEQDDNANLKSAIDSSSIFDIIVDTTFSDTVVIEITE